MTVIQLHGYVHINQTTSDSMCHVMIYLVISSLSHTSTHCHTCTHINIILPRLSQKRLDTASQVLETGCKVAVIRSILCLTIFFLEIKGEFKLLFHIVKKLIKGKNNIKKEKFVVKNKTLKAKQTDAQKSLISLSSFTHNSTLI